MNLSPYIENIHRQLQASAKAGGEETRVVVERLIGPLDASIRLSLQDALSAAAEEITVELAPGSVELRLRDRDPEFVVTLPPSDPTAVGTEEPDDAQGLPDPERPPQGDGGTVSRINLRLPEHLKTRIERAAADEGLSVNSWLVRAAATVVERTDPPRRRERRTSYGSQRFTGWAR